MRQANIRRIRIVNRGKGHIPLHADSKDTDQTEWLPELIWGFAEFTPIVVDFDMLWLSVVCHNTSQLIIATMVLFVLQT